ncbi:MAG: hypothetical protein FWD48_05130 [Oscillospiraceae bacterium]|nr:hypothetical protein [Oscillospiraceae bacterium]
MKTIKPKDKQEDLYDLFNSDEQLIADNYDYKAMRAEALLHNDRDFDYIAEKIPELKIFE